MKSLFYRTYFSVTVLFLVLCSFVFAKIALATEPIKIGIIAEEGTLAGKAIANSAQLAADEINAHGGINGRPIKLFIYDDHVKATDAVEDFQRAVYQHHVVAVVGSWVSEIALALEPWAARLHTIYITTGAASPNITELVYKDYNQYKYVFMTWLNSYFLAESSCDFAKDSLVKQYGIKTAYILSENAAWTKSLDYEYLKCLPQSGIKVVGHIRFAPNTKDFQPIFNSVVEKHAEMVIGGIAHSGMNAIVQWHQGKLPFLFTGVISEASSPGFWQETGGATEGIITSAGTSMSPITPKTIPFAKAYIKKFGSNPPYTGYVTYDTINILANAIQRAKTTNTDALINALEATNYVGVMGHIEFYGKDSQFAHDVKYGKNYIVSPAVQWQHGKLETVWPENAATSKVILPSFVKK